MFLKIKVKKKKKIFFKIKFDEDQTFKTLKLIEEARLTLFKIEDLCLCYRDSPKSFT